MLFGASLMIVMLVAIVAAGASSTKDALAKNDRAADRLRHLISAMRFHVAVQRGVRDRRRQRR